MLYSWYTWQQAALMPMRLAAIAGQQVLANPFLPFSDYRAGRAMAAAFEMVERSTRRYAKPEWEIDHTFVHETWVPVEIEPVLDKPFCTLLHFKRGEEELPAAAGNDPRVLIVAPVSGHFATLLRGTVEAMLPDHEVYITDWKDASQVPLLEGSFGLDDYTSYIVDFLRHLGPNTHVMGVCQPAVPVMMAVSVMNEDNDPAAPATMTLMGGPIDTRVNETEVNEFAQRHDIGWFERTVTAMVPFGYPGAGRRVYPGFLQLSGFMAMNIDRHVGAHLRMFEHLVVGDGDGAEAHRKFYDEYLSVMDLDAKFYLETVERVFQQHALPKGEMMWRDRPIRPENITKTALLTVEGELDDISAVGQTQAAHDLCTGIPAERKRHYLQQNVGHYGIFNGRRWREKIYPVVRDFIAKNGG